MYHLNPFIELDNKTKDPLKKYTYYFFKNLIKYLLIFWLSNTKISMHMYNNKTDVRVKYKNYNLNVY